MLSAIRRKNRQKAKVGNAAKTIVDLVAQGHELVIAHGNGP